MATKTCGLNGSLRDFTTAQGLFAWAAAQNFAGTPPVFEFYNDGGPIADTAQCSMTGAAGLSSGNKATLQPASGQGFRDSATRTTDPLRWNSATGVALTNNLGYAGSAAYITPGNVILDGMQFRTTATSNTGCLSTGGISGNTIRNCIIEANGNYPALSIGQGDSSSSVTNTLILNKGISSGISIQGGGPVLIDQVSIIRPGTAANVGIATAYGGQATVRNSILYGDTTNVQGTFNAASQNNATDAGSFNVANVAGGTPQYGLTSSDFVNTAGASTYDFRPNPSSTKLVGKGASLGYTADVFGNTRSSPTSIGAADVVAASGPTLSSPTASASGPTSAATSITTNTGSGNLYSIVSTSATPPTKAQIQAGQSSTGSAAAWSSGATAVTSTGTKSFTPSGLTASTTYYAYFQQDDGSGNSSTVASSASFATPAAGPTLTSPSAISITTTTATVLVTTNTASGTLYSIVSTSATPPSVTQIQAGQSSTGAAATYAGNQAVSSIGSKNFSATGLTASTVYYAYFQQKDGSNNNSTVVSTTFTTSAPAGPSLTSPTVTNVTNTTATVGVTTDTGSGTLYSVVSSSATPPTKAQIQTGKDSTGATAPWAGSVAVSSTGAKTLNATGLVPNTVYYAYFQQDSASATSSAVVSSSTFTMLGYRLVAGPVVNNTSQSLAGATIPYVLLVKMTDRSIASTLSNQVVDGTSGNLVFQSSAILSGVWYAVVALGNDNVSGGVYFTQGQV